MYIIKKSLNIFCLTYLFLILLSSSPALADTYVSGNITADTTWSKANSPYIVTRTVQVYPGATLTIDPGVTIKFNQGTGLVIGHKLIAIGTEQENITFTSNTEAPGFEDWIGLYFTDTSIDASFDDNGQYVDGCILKYCNIEQGNGIRIESSSPYITQNKIQYNWMCPHGGCCHGTISLNYSSSIIEQNEITNNKADAAICSSYSSSYIVNNIFTNNTSHNGGEGAVVRLTDCNQNHTFNNNEMFDNDSDNGLRTSQCPGSILNNVIENSGTALLSSSACYYNTTSFVNNEFIARENHLAILLFAACSDIFAFHNNNISSETGYSIENGVPYEIDATNNWWGTTITSIIDANIYDYYDDFTLGKVNYQPLAPSAYKKVNFSAQPLNGSFPLQVTFNNHSMGVINSVTWDFGDGETSNEINPIHVYKSAGTFNVILTVAGRSGEIAENKSNYITVDTPNYSLSFSGFGNGSVKVGDTVYTLPWSGQFPSGTDVQIEAIPDSGWSFANWAGALTGSANPTTINISGNKNITANFSQNCDRSLTIIIYPPSAGSVTKTPDKTNYCNNEQVSLTANPITGYNFTSWIGVDSRSGVMAQVTMDTNKTIIASFGQIPVVNYTLSLSKSGNGSVNVNGTVHVLPWSGQFPSGTDVQIEAMPDVGWSFTNWTGDYTGSTNPISININGDKTVTVNFGQNCDKSLTINISPTNSGTIAKNPDKSNYCYNEQVTLTANPNEGYNFSSWVGADSSNGVSAQVTMSSNKTVTANFSQIPVVNYTLSLSKSGSGSVKVNETTHTLPWSGQFVSGTDVQIEAIPDSGWSFTNWTGDYTGSTNPISININGDKTVTANFSQNCDRSLIININPPDSGAVTKSPDKANYCPNEQVTLTANPNEGYNFSSWGGVDSSNGLAANLTMNDTKTVEAHFTQQIVNEPEINVTPAARDFGNIKAGQSSALQTITINNGGIGALVIGMLSINGAHVWAFNMLNDNCTGKTLSQAGSCTLDIVFTPPTGGSFHANLVIPSNDIDEPAVEVNLSGSSGADLAGNWLFLNQTCKNTKKSIKCNIKSKLNIQNVGTTDAVSSVVRFYLSDNATYDAGDVFLKKISTGKLKVGKSVNKTFAYNFKTGISATGKYVIAVLDADSNKVVEADEGNNVIAYGAIP
jgi:hypothetical protein